jgi:hypothetical protein
MSTPATVWVVNVPERIDGIYVFATEAAAAMFEAAVGAANCTVSEESVNTDATALAEAERGDDE